MRSRECHDAGTLGFHKKYFNLCSEDEQKTYGFGTTWGWVINYRIFLFGWTIPLIVIVIVLGENLFIIGTCLFVPWRYFKTWVRWDRKWCLFWEDSLLHWRGGGKIIALSRLTETGKRKPERKNMGIADNLIKMLVASTYGLHYGIRLPVVTPIGLYRQFLADGGRPAVPLWPKDHEGNLQVDSGNPLVWSWLKHMPAFSTNFCSPVQSSASGLEHLQMMLSHFDDTLYAQRCTPRLRHRWRPSGGNPLPVFFLDQPECFLCGSGDRNPNMPVIIAGS